MYGAISFTDKLSSGAVIAIIQELNPRKEQTLVNDVIKPLAEFVALELGNAFGHVRQ